MVVPSKAEETRKQSTYIGPNPRETAELLRNKDVKGRHPFAYSCCWDHRWISIEPSRSDRVFGSHPFLNRMGDTANLSLLGSDCVLGVSTVDRQAPSIVLQTT